MIIPINMPYWYKIVKNAKDLDVQININIDPLNGNQTGSMFYKGICYPFKVVVNKCNMILSFKKFDKEFIQLMNDIFEGEFRLVYYTPNRTYDYHVEWYFNAPKEVIEKEMNSFVNKHKQNSSLRFLFIK